MYLLTVKRGNKRFALARWAGDPDSCLAIAEDAFRMAGYKPSPLDVTWEDRLLAQKNYGGRLPEFREIEVTRAEVDQWADNRHAWYMLTIRGVVDGDMPKDWQAPGSWREM